MFADVNAQYRFKGRLVLILFIMFDIALLGYINDNMFQTKDYTEQNRKKGYTTHLEEAHPEYDILCDDPDSYQYYIDGEKTDESFNIKELDRYDYKINIEDNTAYLKKLGSIEKLLYTLSF